MASVVKEKSREKKKKGRQKRTPSPLTFTNPGALTEDPPPEVATPVEAKAAPEAPAESPGSLSVPAVEPVGVSQPTTERKNRPNRKNGRNRHDRASIADQKAKQRGQEAAVEAPAQAPINSRIPDPAGRDGSSLMETLERLDSRRAAVIKQRAARPHAPHQLLGVPAHGELRRDLRKLEPRQGVQSSQWISHAEAEAMFGPEPLEQARRLREQFATRVSGGLVSCERLYQLYEPLKSYWENIRSVMKKEREMTLSEERCEQARDSLWVVEQKEEVSRGRCADGARVELCVRRAAAAWQAARAPAARLQHEAALESVASDYCVHQHTALINKHDLEERLLEQLAAGEERTRGAIALLFWQLNTAGAGGGGEGPRALLAYWTYTAAYHLLTQHASFENLVLVLHHILGQVHPVRWTLPLIQLQVSGSGDVAKTWAVLETILTCSRLPQDEKPPNSNNGAEPEGDVWLEVEAVGGAVEASPRDVGCALTERDLLALLRQLPVRDALRHMVLVRTVQCNKPQFKGDASGGQAVMKAVCGARVLLDIVRQGLQLHAAYPSVSHWLCRLAHHALHYVADLAEATRKEWAPFIAHLLPSQLECLFNAFWLALESAPRVDIALAYLAHAPFQMLGDENAGALLDNLRADIKADDTIDCYHRLACIATIGQSRPYSDLTIDVSTYLFHMGFLADWGKLQCGAWARSLLARLMYSHPTLYTVTLLLVAHQHPRDGIIEWEWLNVLELHYWRPPVDAMRTVLRKLQDENPPLLEPVIAALQWGSGTRVRMNVQIALAQFVVERARGLAAQRKPTPEWVYQALIDLKLHRAEWQVELSTAPAPADSAFPEPAADGDLATCVWTLLVTSWGHSLPLICQFGVPLMTRLAKAGRCREAVHCLGYVMVVMTQSPESIEHTPSFKTLLSTLLAAGQSYTAMASRLLGRAPQTGQQLLEHMMKTHLLTTYTQLQHGSPRPLLQCWISLLTSADEWASSPQHLTLLDTALGCCRLHRYALDAAHSHLRACLEKKVPSSGWGSLLAGATLQGLVAAGAGPETPYLWLASLRAEHECLERATGLWHQLLWQLHAQRNAKVNVDKALQQAGGPGSAEGLAIYRAATAVLATPLTHIMHLHLWELFFDLFMDRPLDAINLGSKPEEFPPVGPLFFRGLFKSRQLAALKRRLQDTLEHHREQRRPRTDKEEPPAAATAAAADGELSPFTSPGGGTEYTAESPATAAAEARAADPGAVERRAAQCKSVLAYHEAAVKKVNEYISWIEEQPDSITKSTVTSEVDKTTNYPVLDTMWILHFDRSLPNSLRSPPPPRVVHVSPRKSAPWHSVVEETYLAADPVDRMIRRYQDYPLPLELLPPPEPLETLLRADIMSSRRLLEEIDECLKEMVTYAREFGAERAALAALDGELWEQLPRLHVARAFRTSERRGCGEQCAGPADLTVEGEEWCVNEGVERAVSENRRRRRVLLDALTAPREHIAELAARLMLLLRRMECEAVACAAFDRLVACMSGQLEECPPLRDTVTSLAVQLGERYISSDAVRCAKLVLRDALPGGAALVNSLLEPRRLPPDHFPRLYAAILRHGARPHSTFSHLSKFKVDEWHDSNPEMRSERAELIGTILGALLEHGPEPGADHLVLLELLARHLELLVEATELGETVKRATRAAVASELPPFLWTSLQRVTERCAADLRLPDLKDHLSAMGTCWWEARMRAAPVCSLGARAPHALPVARVLRAYGRAVLADLKAIRPPYSMELMAVTAFKSSCEAWHAWLLAWWGERRELTEPLLPWGSNDTELAKQIVDVFLASIECILTECPGGEGRLLLEVFWWAVEATWRPVEAAGAAAPARHAHVLMTQLVRLPWTRHAWFHVSCLPQLIEVCSRDVECQMFAVVTLRATRTWLPADLDAAAASRTLAALLRVLTRLPFPPETLEHATNTLPWEQLETEDFEPALDEYFSVEHTVGAPAHVKASFPLILAAATMSASMCVIATHAAYARAALGKRLALLARWTRAVGEAHAAGAAGDRAAAGVARLLRAVQETCIGNRNPPTLDNNEECLETCEVLLERAAATLCTAPLCNTVLKKWQEWARQAPQVMLRAALRVVSDVASRDCFVTLSDALMRYYLRNGGSWEEVLARWRNRAHADVAAHVRARCLYTAYATAQQEVRARRAPPPRVAARALRTLHDADLNLKSMEEPLVMLLCFIIRNLPIELVQCKKDGDTSNANDHCDIHSSPVASGSANLTDDAAKSTDVAQLSNSDSEISPDPTVSAGAVGGSESAQVADSDSGKEAEVDITPKEYYELTSSLLKRWVEPPRYQLLKKITMQSSKEFSDHFREVCSHGLYLVTATRRCAGWASPADEQAFKTMRKERTDAAGKKPLMELSSAAEVRSACRRFDKFCVECYPEAAALLALEAAD